MRIVDIIARKRDGQPLTTEEISSFVNGYVRGEIPDYQVAAWLMAVVLRGMDARETADLTLAMATSGRTLSLRSVAPVVADKHSSGGVGDKTTLVVAPLVAAAGLPVAKMSGRGLGFTGGTLDKLESIPGFEVSLSVDRLIAQVARCGVAISGQTAELAPADGLLYELRNATATVPSIPLIASSIMSKKLAAGADVIVLDVKVGRGAFMRDLRSARRLAELMVHVGRRAGRRVVALLASMDQPLGYAVGNSLEVVEAVEALRGRGPADLSAHCLVLAAHMLLLGGCAPDLSAARELARAALRSGRALARLREMIECQGGDPRVVDDPWGVLPRAPISAPVLAPKEGYVAELDAERVGLATLSLGAGRERKGEPIDHRVGVVLHKKVGDKVRAGEPLFTVHAADAASLHRATGEVLAAYRWSGYPVRRPRLLRGVIGAEAAASCD
ncbi:MAG: thymidine phosphorylase [Anaerolineae bacterium]|nr:thymidine phosphorylase [Anaerolineae bacterium]